MTSIERTAYPRFKRLPSVRELHLFYTTQPDAATVPVDGFYRLFAVWIYVDRQTLLLSAHLRRQVLHQSKGSKVARFCGGACLILYAASDAICVRGFSRSPGCSR